MDYKKILAALKDLDFNTLSTKQKKYLLGSLRATVYLLEQNVAIDEALGALAGK